MKALLISFLLLPQFIQSKNVDYKNFVKFVLQNFKVTSKIRRNCDWQYAIVKMKTDVNGKVINVELLNSGSNKIEANFTYLLGYKFDKALKIKNCSLVFCYTVDNGNLGKDCDVPPQNYQPSNVTIKILDAFNTQRKKEPSTVFIFEPVIGVIYPTEH